MAEWPEKPVKFVSPYPPGGSVDPLARLFAAKLSDSLKQQFIVENRVGASGIIGTDYVAKSAPDGYTFVFIFDTHAVHKALNAKVPFDPIKDFSPVMLVGTAPMAITTAASKPYKTFADVLKAAKAKPDTLTVGNVGNGSLGHLATVLLNQAAGIKLVAVPYKGGGPLSTDTMGGQIDFAMASVAAQAAHIRGGKLRALVQTGDKRSHTIPDVPTLAEAGVPGYDAVIWLGLIAPKGTPPEIVTRLNAEITKIVSRPDVQADWAKQGAVPLTMTPAAFERYLADDIVKWERIVKLSGARPDR